LVSTEAVSEGRIAEDYRQALLGRIDALGRTHHLLFRSEWREAELRSLADGLDAFVGQPTDAISKPTK
jgi:HWE histidine kinase